MIKRTCDRISKGQRQRRSCREKANVVRTRQDAQVPRKRQRGRQKTRWKESCKSDMESVGLKVEDVLDRTKW